MAKPAKPAGPAPSEARLHEAALAHLARFAATEAGLRRVLHRRIDRWARAAAAEGAEVAEAVRAAKAQAAQVAQRLVAAGAVDDAAFAAARARRLARGGRSRRAIAAHLAAKGVASEAAAAALPTDELAAALALCRRRRFGPFAPGPMPPEARLRALGVLARAGFARDTAERALDLAPEEAEERLLAMRNA
jgi:regulatory protein